MLKKTSLLIMLLISGQVLNAAHVNESCSSKSIVTKTPRKTCGSILKKFLVFVLLGTAAASGDLVAQDNLNCNLESICKTDLIPAGRDLVDDVVANCNLRYNGLPDEYTIERRCIVNVAGGGRMDLYLNKLERGGNIGNTCGDPKLVADAKHYAELIKICNQNLYRK